jgi:hypothetical protein
MRRQKPQSAALSWEPMTIVKMECSRSSPTAQPAPHCCLGSQAESLSSQPSSLETGCAPTRDPCRRIPQVRRLHYELPACDSNAGLEFESPRRL